MSKDKDPQSPAKNEKNKNSHQEELNRRKALKTILGASSLMVINPFSMSAESTSPLMTVTPSASVSPSSSISPTPTTSVSPSNSISPTPTTSVSPSNSMTPTPTTSVSPSNSISPTPTTSVSPSNSISPTPTTSVSPSNSISPTPTTSVSPSSSMTPTPTTSVSPSSSMTPTPTPSASSIVLPVELSEFGVREENGVIKLFWRTESETNNKGFEVQRSTNTFTFNKIGWVAGKGNSNHAVNYEFEEINVKSNQWYYYRLKQIDFDGASEFSKTIAIMINEENKTTVKNISPNIVTDNFINVEIAAGSVDKAEIFIYHFNGQLVTSKKVAIDKGNNTIRMNLQNTVSGMYVVNVKFGKGKSQTKRFIVK